jgi:hypothetical protein
LSNAVAHNELLLPKGKGMSCCPNGVFHQISQEGEAKQNEQPTEGAITQGHTPFYRYGK